MNRSTAASTRSPSAASTRLLRAYERGLDVVLRHQFATLCVFLATVALTGYLFVSIPKGFFPQQDTGLITGIIGSRRRTCRLPR